MELSWLESRSWMKKMQHSGPGQLELQERQVAAVEEVGRISPSPCHRPEHPEMCSSGDRLGSPSGDLPGVRKARMNIAIMPGCCLRGEEVWCHSANKSSVADRSQTKHKGRVNSTVQTDGC